MEEVFTIFDEMVDEFPDLVLETNERFDHRFDAALDVGYVGAVLEGNAAGAVWVGAIFGIVACAMNQYRQSSIQVYW